MNFLLPCSASRYLYAVNFRYYKPKGRIPLTFLQNETPTIWKTTRRNFSRGKKISFYGNGERAYTSISVAGENVHEYRKYVPTNIHIFVRVGINEKNNTNHQNNIKR